MSNDLCHFPVDPDGLLFLTLARTVCGNENKLVSKVHRTTGFLHDIDKLIHVMYIIIQVIYQSKSVLCPPRNEYILIYVFRNFSLNSYTLMLDVFGVDMVQPIQHRKTKINESDQISITV